MAARSAPKGSENQLRRLPGAKKIHGRARGGPGGNLETGFAPLKTDPPPPAGGGEARSAPLHFGAFLLENLAAASAWCKIEGSWVLGGHSREKLKLLSTTSKLVV